MKKFLPSLLAVAVVVLASRPLLAQTAYTITFTSTAQGDADLIENIANDNNRTCLRLNLAISCTQAQACVAPGFTCAGGASCTATQARACNARIFSSATTADRQEFMLHHYILPGFFTDVEQLPPFLQDTMCRRWQTQTPTERNAACVAHGLTSTVANPCRLCRIIP